MVIMHRSLKEMRSVLFLLVFFSIQCIFLFSAEFTDYEWNYSIQLPAEWNRQITSDSAFFFDPGLKTYVEIRCQIRNELMTVKKLMTTVTEELKASGEWKSLVYLGNEAIMAQIVMSRGGKEYKGWIFFYVGIRNAYAVYAYVEKALYQEREELLLSVIDSFSPGEDSRWLPGPVMLLESPVYSEDIVKNFDYRQRPLNLYFGSGERDSLERFFLREKSLFSEYFDGESGQNENLIRLYHVLFRGAFESIAEMASAIEGIIAEPDEWDIAVVTLGILRNWRSPSTQPESEDPASPLSVIESETGSEASLGLLYAIILAHHGIDSLLLFSPTRDSLWFGVNLPFKGEAIGYRGKRYLIGTFNKVNAPGQMAGTRPEFDDWIIIPFQGKRNFRGFE